MQRNIDALLTAAVIALLFPWQVLSAGSAPQGALTAAFFEERVPFEQDLVVTAYYSPLPDQCCYVRGGLEADMELNGEGHHAANGTKVYPGMVAAPPSYPFGTRIHLLGIGTVTVHDRGGAIQERKDAHRLDLWVGYGEEGLARALAFGVQRLRATVYPPSSQQPAESIDLARLPAPPEKLSPYLTEGTTLLSVRAKLGDRTASVQFLQKRLAALGYFDDHASGFFGPVTQQSMHAFYNDAGVNELDDQLTEIGAAHLESAYQRVSAQDPITRPVDAGSAPARIAEAQRAMRFLGFYKGRTDGQYSETFRKAVLVFQKQQGIVSVDSAAGAGSIGPQTRQRIVSLWNRKHIAMGAKRLLALRKLDQLIAKRGYDLRTFLNKGDKGENVRTLQKFLALKGYLGSDGITGTFGTRTEQALIAYQRDTGIITDDADTGAGFAGPATLAKFRQDVRKSLLQIVRARGWNAMKLDMSMNG